MKYLAKICIAGLAALSLAACSHVAQYTGEDFVAFRSGSYSVSETSGSIKVPVIAYPQNGNPNTTVSFKVVEGSAKAGTNFSVEPASGVLTFAGDSTQYITVNVKNQAGLYTGDLSFGIEITSTTNDYTFNHYNAVKFNIKDEDHPLINYFGSYTTSYCMGYWGDNYSGHTIELAAWEGDVNSFSISNLEPYLGGNGFKGPVKGVLNAEKTVITVAAGQATGYNGVNYYGFDAPNPEDAESSEADIIINIQEDGSLFIPNAWGAASSSGWYEILLGGVTYKKN
jgi:hypothetical protein